jgi:hypothetical protein
MRPPYDPTLLVACTMASPRRSHHSTVGPASPSSPLLFCPLLSSWIWLGVQQPASISKSPADAPHRLFPMPDSRGTHEAL